MRLGPLDAYETSRALRKEADCREFASRASCVVAVVPIFNPGGDVPARLTRLRSQVDALIAVDDGSRLDDDLTLLAVAEAVDVLVRLPENRGIAAALNEGVRRALGEFQAEYVLTVDQDTDLAPDYVFHALDIAARAADAGVSLGAVCAGSINSRASTVDEQRRGMPVAIEPIQSGLLIPVSTFDSVGLFDERLIIDCVDTAFLLRMRVLGRVAVISPRSSVTQPFGESRPVRLLGRERYLVRYPPLRHYYIARNRTIMYRQYGRCFPFWCCRSMIREVKQALVSILAGPSRRAKLRGSWTGLVDGLRGRHGKIRSEA